jgi:hypothetical protein
MNRTVLAGVAACAVVAASAAAPSAAAKGFRRSPQILRVETPLGLQGTAGSGANIVIPFVVADITGKPVDVEVQYGADYNADGLITDDEYRTASEDRLDSRDTRLNTVPQLFTTGTLEMATDSADVSTGAVNGAAQAYVWKSTSDVGRHALRTLEYALTPQGRRIVDPNDPNSWLLVAGSSGVKVRVRTVLVEKRPNRRPRKRTTYGEWRYTDAFALNNSLRPSATIDSVEEGSPTLVHWTAFDPDSEDLNGNGVMDVADGEDMNGNGLLDCERVGVAFDFHWLAEGEDPSLMTDAQLAGLNWLPCTHVADVGDTDALAAQPGVPIPQTGENAGVCSAPPGVGRQWVFAWDAELDDAGTTRGMILRATPFDAERNVGTPAYSRIVVHTAQ